MAQQAPGKHTRKGITVEEAHRMFATDRKAEKWFIEARYGDEDNMFCPRCGSTETKRIKHPTMPFWCKDCRKHFSIKTGTAMERSRIAIRHWARLIYIEATELRGTPSMKIHRDFGITQKSAWFMLHRIRESYIKMVSEVLESGKFRGTVEVDETSVGGKANKMNKKQKRAFKARGGGTGMKGKELVAAVKERESGKIVPKRIEDTSKETLQGLVYDTTEKGAKVMTDEAHGYKGLVDREHLAVNHSAKNFVVGKAHNNGLESFWSTFKHGINGSFYKLSPKHIERYANEFAGRHNDRPLDTRKQMALLAKGLVGRRLTYKDLIADNGLSNFARPLAGSDEEMTLLEREVDKPLPPAPIDTFDDEIPF